jgi:hypothetical protein
MSPMSRPGRIGLMAPRKDHDPTEADGPIIGGVNG